MPVHVHRIISYYIISCLVSYISLSQLGHKMTHNYKCPPVLPSITRWLGSFIHSYVIVSICRWVWLSMWPFTASSSTDRSRHVHAVMERTRHAMQRDHIVALCEPPPSAPSSSARRATATTTTTMMTPTATTSGPHKGDHLAAILIRRKWYDDNWCCCCDL